MNQITSSEWIQLGEDENNVQYRIWNIYTPDWPKDITEFISIPANYGGI